MQAARAAVRIVADVSRAGTRTGRSGRRRRISPVLRSRRCPRKQLLRDVRRASTRISVCVCVCVCVRAQIVVSHQPMAVLLQDGPGCTALCLAQLRLEAADVLLEAPELGLDLRKAVLQGGDGAVQVRNQRVAV